MLPLSRYANPLRFIPKIFRHIKTDRVCFA